MALVPFGFLLLFGLLRANHDEFMKAEKTANSALHHLKMTKLREEDKHEERLEARRRRFVLDSLGRARSSGQHYFSAIDGIDTDDFEDYCRVEDRVRKWEEHVRSYLDKEWTLRSLFGSDVGLPDQVRPDRRGRVNRDICIES